MFYWRDLPFICNLEFFIPFIHVYFMWKGLYKQSVESYILLVGINFTANILYTHIFLNIDRRGGIYVRQISLVYSK